MRANKEYVTEKFNEFNRTIFGNELPSINIRIGNAKTMLGSISYKKKTTWKKTVYYDFKLTVSSYSELTEKEIEDVIIHEMIHYYILYFNIKDTSSHGVTFRRIMNSINKNFKRNITISKRNATPLPERSATKLYLVCTGELANGKLAVSVIPKSKIFTFWSLLPKLFKIRNVKWYASRDKYFDRYPKCVKPKMYVAEDDISSHLTNANELTKTDNKIIFLKREQ